MTCNLPKHGKMQPNHPHPVGPPFEYMKECQVFDSIRSNIYDLCQLYAMGMMEDPPGFPSLWEPVTHGQVWDLLKLARTIGQPYMILAHSTDPVLAVSLLWELHTITCMCWLHVDLQGKSMKLSFCPFCAYAKGNDLSYLNHIIIAHYNGSYGCRKCLKHVFVSSSALHNHKKVCIGLVSKKSVGNASSKPCRGGGDSSCRAPTKGTPKKDGKTPAPDLQGSSTTAVACSSPHCSGHEVSSYKDLKELSSESREKKKRRTAATTRLISSPSATTWPQLCHN